MRGMNIAHILVKQPSYPGVEIQVIKKQTKNTNYHVQFQILQQIRLVRPSICLPVRRSIVKWTHHPYISDWLVQALLMLDHAAERNPINN